jgi:hypothetical protein
VVQDLEAEARREGREVFSESSVTVKGPMHCLIMLFGE